MNPKYGDWSNFQSDGCSHLRELSSTPTAVPRSEFGLQGAPGEDVGTSTGGVYFVDGEPDVETDVEVEL